MTTNNGAPLSYSRFMCGRCHRPSNQAGRRRRFVLGMQEWVCALCVAKEAPTHRANPATSCIAKAPRKK